MPGKHPPQPSIGRITYGLAEGDNLALRIVEFVEGQLPAWRDDPDRPVDELSENALNAQLCKFLNSGSARDASPMFHFDREEKQVGRTHVDLSASPAESMVLNAKPYSIYEPILVIECKRLPAPSRDRQREYVTGGDKRNGGIQRFKLGLYAAGQDLTAMVGYVQEGSLRDWHAEINRWIRDQVDGVEADRCTWAKDEYLELIREGVAKGAARYRSSHVRTGTAHSPRIAIHHLWVAMRPSKTSRPAEASE